MASIWGAAAFAATPVDLSSLPEGVERIDVYLLLGQSNMKGRGEIPEVQPEDPLIVNMNMSDNNWYVARHPLHKAGAPDLIDGSDNAGVGPGLDFARAVLLQEPGVRIALVPCAVGGSWINLWQPGREFYNSAIARAQKALSDAPEGVARIRGVLWLQGESDATEARYSAYAGRLSTLIQALRADLGEPELRFIGCTIGTFINSDNYPRVAEINDILLTLPEREPNTACVDARDLTGHIGDNMHYDTASQVIIGDRYAKEYLGLSTEEPIVEVLVNEDFSAGQGAWATRSAVGGVVFSEGVATVSPNANGQPGSAYRTFGPIILGDGDSLSLGVDVSATNTAPRPRDIKMALGYAAPLVEGDSTTLAIPMSGYAASLSTGNDNADPRVTWVDNAGGVVNFFNSSTANLGELAMDDSLYADATMRRYDFIITRDGSSLVFSGSFDGSPFSTTVAAGPPNLIPDFQFNTVGLAYAYSPGESVSYDNVAVKVSRSGAFTYPPVQLDALYASGCVLQRDRLVTVRGSAQPGETLTLSVAAQLKNAVVDPEGNWSIVLDPEPAGGPFFLQVEGTLSQATRLNDVYFGDVWVLCGQSNMEQSVFTQSTNYPTYYPPFPDAADDFDDIRFLLLRPVQGLDGPAGKPLLDKPWTRWAQAELAEMSAAGYFFARELKARLVENGQGDVPLGFIKACKGGTAAEQWVSADALALMPEALIPRADKPASTYYNGMIAPIQGYSVKGVLWYQGEANADTIGRIEQYPLLFNTLVQSWRAQWNHPEMPFYFVQLAPFQAYLDEPRDRLWAWMRGAQAECRSIGNTGMACIIDSGLQGDIHPPFKDRVGRRLARLALAGSYGIAMIDKGPTVSRVETSAGEAVITFDNVAGGLQTLAVDAQPDSEEIAEGKLPVSVGADELAGFALCGSDRIFYRATKAEIIGPHQVRVSNLLDVPEPVAVRYAWESFPRCNLFNSEGLPAEPFRGDAYAFNTAAGAPSTPPGLAYALWQEEHFSPEELGTPDLESSVWGYDADPDGDGLGNLLEYAFGLDPRASDGSLQPISIVVESGQLKVRYLVSRKAKADPYLDLRLETTSELSRQSGWSVLDEPYILHTDNVFSEIREVALPSLNVANPARFIRVHALRAAP